ncbi:MAG TPA: 2OG-Fe(II) oxygenase, partial [Rhizomicrobium sp.]|nr:2OG-Fe(II) oxygenase [Rhizomicrobium sp.]
MTAKQDWEAAAISLNAQGWALLPKLIDAKSCTGLRNLYEKEVFRSTVVMARHGFGRGEYKYFAYPLPGPLANLRGALYAKFAPIANR